METNSNRTHEPQGFRTAVAPDGVLAENPLASPDRRRSASAQQCYPVNFFTK